MDRRLRLNHQSQDYQFGCNIRRSQSTFGRCYAAAQPGNLVGEPPVSTSASAFNVEFEREADGNSQWCCIWSTTVILLHLRALRRNNHRSLQDSKLISVHMIFRGWKPRAAAASSLKATQINSKQAHTSISRLRASTEPDVSPLK
jgi:hypothetical protein